LFEAFKKFQVQNNFIGELILFGTESVGSKDLGQGVTVKLLGNANNTSQLNEIYNCMDWYVSPSLAESFGLTIAEANACKVPAIGFLVGGVNDIIENIVNGFGSDSISPDSLFNLLNQTLIHKNQYHTFAINAFKKVTDNYAINVIVRKHIDLYNRLLTI
jgi:glycosyltransferase involved in cell wall biosynthesis